MSQEVRCHACQTTFALDPEKLRPYRDSFIQGQRAPRYWLRCPVCGQKNVIELSDDSEVIPGKPSAR
jgi:hypothetical protein